MISKAIGVIILMTCLGGTARAETIYAATCQTLFRFDSATPGTIDWSIPLPGFEVAECLDGLDFDPRSGLLYGHAHVNCQIACGPEYITWMFVLDPESGVATTFWGDNGLSGIFADVGDFDAIPTPGDLRMVGNNGGFNMRLDPLTANVSFDAPLAPFRPIAGVAHHPNAVLTAGTETYGIAYTGVLGMPLDLVRLGGPGGDPPASSGELSVIGPLGIDVGFVTGFDISPAGTAYMSTTVQPPRGIGDPGHGQSYPPSHLYTIDLVTGTATDLGEIAAPDGYYVSAIAAAVPRGVVTIPALDRASQGLLAALLALTGAWLLFRRRRRSA